MLFVSSAKDFLIDLKMLVEECSVFVLAGRLSALVEFLPGVVAEVIPGVGARRYL